jgi:hypothetical protein
METTRILYCVNWTLCIADVKNSCGDVCTPAAKKAFFRKFALDLNFDQPGGSVGNKITVVIVQVV